MQTMVHARCASVNSGRSVGPCAARASSRAAVSSASVGRAGCVAVASSLDQPGPCARNVLDAALLHEVIAGHDPYDSTSIDAPVPPVVVTS